MQPAAANPLAQLLPWILIMGLLYLIVIRPQQKEQQKKQKDHQELISNLKKNDEVITVGGLHGTVVNVKDKTVVIRVDDNTRIEMEKNCIANKAKNVK